MFQNCLRCTNCMAASEVKGVLVVSAAKALVVRCSCKSSVHVCFMYDVVKLMPSVNLCERLPVSISSFDLKKSLGAPRFKLTGVLFKFVTQATAPKMG